MYTEFYRALSNLSHKVMPRQLAKLLIRLLQGLKNNVSITQYCTRKQWYFPN